MKAVRELCARIISVVVFISDQVEVGVRGPEISVGEKTLRHLYISDDGQCQ